MDKQVLKYKRQVRDFYNKNVHDEATIGQVAIIIGFYEEEQEKCYTQPNTGTVDQIV